MTNTMDLGLAALASDEVGVGVLGAAMGAVTLGVASLALCYRVEADDGDALVVEATDPREARVVFWAHRMRVQKKSAPRFFKTVAPIRRELVSDWWVQDAPGLPPRHVFPGLEAAAEAAPTGGGITVYETALEREMARRFDPSTGEPRVPIGSAPEPYDIYAGLEWKLGAPQPLTKEEIKRLAARPSYAGTPYPSRSPGRGQSVGDAFWAPKPKRR